MTGCTVPRALWAAKKAVADKKKKDESSSGQRAEREAVPGVAAGGGELSNRLPILLLLPLLRSQSKANPELREEVGGLLFSNLLEVGDGQALAPQVLKELAGLLATWLEESSSPKVAAWCLLSLTLKAQVAAALVFNTGLTRKTG